MAKRKDTTALFEVINRGKGVPKRVELPAWAEPSQAQAAPAPDAPPPAAPEEQPAPPAAAGPQEAPALPAAPRAAAAWIDGGRLNVRLSLNYVTCTVAALVAVGLLVAAYVLGQASGRRHVAGPPAPAAAAPVFEAQKGLQTRFAALPPGDYMIVQNNVLTMEDATAIQKFLYENGIDAGIRDAGNGRFQVIELYNYASRTQAEQSRMAAKAEATAKTLRENLGTAASWRLRDRYNFAEAGWTKAGNWYQVTKPKP